MKKQYISSEWGPHIARANHHISNHRPMVHRTMELRATDSSEPHNHYRRRDVELSCNGNGTQRLTEKIHPSTPAQSSPYHRNNHDSGHHSSSDSSRLEWTIPYHNFTGEERMLPTINAKDEACTGMEGKGCGQCFRTYEEGHSGNCLVTESRRDAQGGRCHRWRREVKLTMERKAGCDGEMRKECQEVAVHDGGWCCVC